MKFPLCLLFCCVTLLSVTEAVEPFPPQSLPGVDIGNGLGAGYETSGIVWHSRLERFFTVDDGGQVSSMDVNGSDVAHFGLPGDLEGIAVADPSSDFIYIGREDGNKIVQYNFVTGQATKIFSLASWMGSGSNSGLEALTFVPDANDPEGGLFYAGRQSDGFVFAFRLPIVSGVDTRDYFQFSFQSGRSDLSGLHFDNTNEVLYAIWDSGNRLRAMQSDGTFLEEWVLPGTRQEGITFQGTNLLIAQDNGPDAIRYSSFPLIVPEPASRLLCLGLITILIASRNFGCLQFRRQGE